MEREQFTFYASFYRAIRRIKNKAARCDAYDAIAEYALTGKLPDLDALPDAAAIAFDLTRPVLDTASRKSKGGKTDARQREDNGKTTGRHGQECGKEKEGEKEKEVEVEVENECYTPSPSPLKSAADPFDVFWQEYPRKTGDIRQAVLEFDRATVSGASLGEMLAALAWQKETPEWTEDGGRYIPSAEKWLRNRGWTATQATGMDTDNVFLRIVERGARHG